jgi:hypothetical protein
MSFHMSRLRSTQLDARVDARLRALNGAHVTDTFHHFSAELPAVFGGFCQRQRIAIPQYQTRTLFGVRAGDGRPDAAASAGDNGAFVVQLHGVFLKYRRWAATSGRELARDALLPLRKCIGCAGLIASKLPPTVMVRV